MSSLVQEAVEKICQLFQDCSSALQLEVRIHKALAYYCSFEKFICCLVCSKYCETLAIEMGLRSKCYYCTLIIVSIILSPELSDAILIVHNYKNQPRISKIHF